MSWICTASLNPPTSQTHTSGATDCPRPCTGLRSRGSPRGTCHLQGGRGLKDRGNVRRCWEWGRGGGGTTPNPHFKVGQTKRRDFSHVPAKVSRKPTTPRTSDRLLGEIRGKDFSSFSPTRFLFVCKVGPSSESRSPSPPEGRGRGPTPSSEAPTRGRRPGGPDTEGRTGGVGLQVGGLATGVVEGQSPGHRVWGRS